MLDDLVTGSRQHGLQASVRGGSQFETQRFSLTRGFR
jgi:hypothetical protein